MRHVHSLRFDTLEAKKLLSKAPVAVAHTAPAVVAAPLVLNGTLALDNNAASETTNPDGSTTTTTPVAGRLGALGRVRGVWNETMDQYGDIDGLDTLRLRLPKGTIVVEFDNEDPGASHPAGHGDVYYEEAQRIGAAAGAYVRSSESGSIELFPNYGRSNIESLVLHTRTT